MAKRRKWAVLAVVLSGLVSYSDAARAQSMSVRRIPLCRGESLKADLVQGAVSPALHHQAMTLAMQNRSSKACELDGVPDIAFADKQQNPLPVHVCSNCPAYLFPVLPVETVVLQPRQAAYFVVEYTAVVNDQGCKEAATFSLRLTKNGGPIRIHLSGMRPCGVVDVTPFLAKLPPHGLFPNSEAAEDAQK